MRKTRKHGWGLFDTQDRCWVGDTAGPLLYNDEEIARLAAEVVCVQLGWPLTRVRATLYDGTATQLKDNLPTLVTPEEAIRRLESP